GGRRFSHVPYPYFLPAPTAAPPSAVHGRANRDNGPGRHGTVRAFRPGNDDQENGMAANLVLVTGSAGRVGRAGGAETKARGVPVRSFDRVPTPGLTDAHLGDLTDASAVQRAMQGVGTLIHLGATPDDDDFLAQLVPNNVIGVYHVFEAARQAGVKRLIL